MLEPIDIARTPADDVPILFRRCVISVLEHMSGPAHTSADEYESAARICHDKLVTSGRIRDRDTLDLTGLGRRRNRLSRRKGDTPRKMREYLRIVEEVLPDLEERQDIVE